MSTHWFHDHMLDFTAQNVYKGNAVMMNYYSAIDRGNEALQDGVNLRFPSGSGMPWGNRDYDVNLVIADKAWDQNGQLWFNPFNTDGFLGDQVLVNWQYQPRLRFAPAAIASGSSMARCRATSSLPWYVKSPATAASSRALPGPTCPTPACRST